MSGRRTPTIMCHSQQSANFRTLLYRLNLIEAMNRSEDSSRKARADSLKSDNPQENISQHPLSPTRMNNSITQTRPALDFVKKLVLEHPGATISTALAALLVPWCIGNYRKFYALGHSGLGQGIGGWFIATLVTLTFGRETLTTAEYDRDPNKETFLKDLASIPERRGSRPEIGWHCIPHRQMSRLPTNKTITDVGYRA